MADPEDTTDETTDKTTDETGTPRIDDDQLPEDLRPSEDNPLAEPLGPDEDVEGVSLQDRAE